MLTYGPDGATTLSILTDIKTTLYKMPMSKMKLSIKYSLYITIKISPIMLTVMLTVVMPRFDKLRIDVAISTL